MGQRVRISTKRPLVQAKNILIRVRQYGFWRPYLLQIVDRYLDCVISTTVLPALK
jgi:hypothetical protein